MITPCYSDGTCICPGDVVQIRDAECTVVRFLQACRSRRSSKIDKDGNQVIYSRFRTEEVPSMIVCKISGCGEIEHGVETWNFAIAKIISRANGPITPRDILDTMPDNDHGDPRTPSYGVAAG